jgi:hypothetical protein
VGRNLVFTFETGDTLTLRNTKISQLAGDVVFDDFLL